MSIALWTVLFAGILPPLTVAIAKRAGGSYDNRDPRGWAQGLDGFRKRAHAAHLNAYEFFPLFAVAVLLAEWKLGASTSVDRMALGIIGARLLYTATYLSDHAKLRSVAWMIAWLGTIALFVMGGMGK